MTLHVSVNCGWCGDPLVWRDTPGLISTGICRPCNATLLASLPPERDLATRLTVALTAAVVEGGLPPVVA